ncbi:hypothetical protein GCM10010483_20700 [Actinokineospora diospyrosa]
MPPARVGYLVLSEAAPQGMGAKEPGLRIQAARGLWKVCQETVELAMSGQVWWWGTVLCGRQVW